MSYLNCDFNVIIHQITDDHFVVMFVCVYRELIVTCVMSLCDTVWLEISTSVLCAGGGQTDGWHSHLAMWAVPASVLQDSSPLYTTSCYRYFHTKTSSGSFYHGKVGIWTWTSCLRFGTLCGYYLFVVVINFEELSVLEFDRKTFQQGKC